MGHPEIESLDMNPLVLTREGELIILDAKLHVYVQAEAGHA